MNFLGHCLFSEPTADALAGSLWPDFAKRPTTSDISKSFYAHFDRHQQIDRITDTHSLLEPIRVDLRPVFRKTTPVILDMMLDHHLAQHWSKYHPDTLEAFADHSYRQLQRFQLTQSSERFQRTVYWMTEQNWFVSYRTEQGMYQALEGMARRIRFTNPIVDHRHQVIEATKTHHAQLDAFVTHLLAVIGTPF